MFFDRTDAGARLAKEMPPGLDDALVLGIPRGGVVVAAAVAAAMSAHLDVIVVHKLGAPGNPELAIGAVGPDGTVVLDEHALAVIGEVDDAHLQGEAARQREEIERRLEVYAGGLVPDVAGRTCVLVDDGIATGSTARAALLWLRARGAARTVLAVPVAPARSIETFRDLADDIVCLARPPVFYAVGEWYRVFDDVADETVLDALRAARDPRA